MNKDNHKNQQAEAEKETAKPKGIMSKLRSIFGFAKQTFAFANKVGDIVGTVKNHHGAESYVGYRNIVYFC